MPGLREVILYRARQWELAAVEEVNISGFALPGGLRGTCLIECTKLRALSLRKCGLEALVGIEVLSATLERLDIGDNKLTALAALASFAVLSELIADGNRIPSEAITGLKPVAQTLRILDLRGNPCASAPGHAERCEDALSHLRVLDGTPMAVLRVVSAGQRKAVPWTAPAIPPGPWLPPAGPLKPAGAGAAKQSQDEFDTAVRSFELLSRRAEEDTKKARERYTLPSGSGAAAGVRA